MAKIKKPKPIKYSGTFNEKTGQIDWTSPVIASTNPRDPPPPKKP